MSRSSPEFNRGYSLGFADGRRDVLLSIEDALESFDDGEVDKITATVKAFRKVIAKIEGQHLTT